MTCQATRVMTTVREAEIRVLASTQDQILECQAQQLTDVAEEMEANLCECGQLTRWYKGTDITLVGRLMWVHISRNHADEFTRVSGRMRCPTTLGLRTSCGRVELRLTGVVIHTGEPIVVALPDGRHGETVRSVWVTTLLTSTTNGGGRTECATLTTQLIHTKRLTETCTPRST